MMLCDDDASLVDPASVSFWDACLYGGVQAFGETKTSNVLSQPIDSLLDYARTERVTRTNNPYGDVYYTETDALSVSGKTLLDFGCGSGIDSLHFAERGALVTCCDIVPANVLLTSRLLLPYNARSVLIRDYDELRYLTPFDVVYSHGCLHHVPTEGLRILTRNLGVLVKPTGFLVLLVYTPLYYPSIDRVTEGPFTCGYSLGDLVALFGDNFRVLSYRVLNHETYAWTVFTKI